MDGHPPAAGRRMMPLFRFGGDVAIDLGTANSLMCIRGRGIVLREPSVVALEGSTGEVLAVGTAAHRMLGRTPGTINAVRPLRHGVIADYDITEALLRHFLDQALGRRLMRPRVIVCVPSGVTTIERRAVLDAAIQAGARRAFVLEEVVAAALGGGLDISEVRGNMVLDVGGGTTDVAVLSLGGVVVRESLRVGGDDIDQALVRYVRQNFNLMIGERMAEQAKIEAGTAVPSLRNEKWNVRGRDLITGLPRNLAISSRDIFDAIKEVLDEILAAVHRTLEQCPPELAADIVDRGIVLSGGGAMLHGFDTLVGESTGVPAFLAESPLDCVARGTGKTLESIDTWSSLLLSRSS